MTGPLRAPEYPRPFGNKRPGGRLGHAGLRAAGLLILCLSLAAWLWGREIMDLCAGFSGPGAMLLHGLRPALPYTAIAVCCLVAVRSLPALVMCNAIVALLLVVAADYLVHELRIDICPIRRWDLAAFDVTMAATMATPLLGVVLVGDLVAHAMERLRDRRAA